MQFGRVGHLKHGAALDGGDAEIEKLEAFHRLDRTAAVVPQVQGVAGEAVGTTHAAAAHDICHNRVEARRPAEGHGIVCGVAPGSAPAADDVPEHRAAADGNAAD